MTPPANNRIAPARWRFTAGPVNLARMWLRKTVRSAAWLTALLGLALAVAAWRCRADARLIWVRTADHLGYVEVTPRHLTGAFWRRREYDGLVRRPPLVSLHGKDLLTTVEPTPPEPAGTDEKLADAARSWHALGFGLVKGNTFPPATPSLREAWAPTGFVVAIAFAPLALSIATRRRQRPSPPHRSGELMSAPTRPASQTHAARGLSDFHWVEHALLANMPYGRAARLICVLGAGRAVLRPICRTPSSVMLRRKPPAERLASQTDEAFLAAIGDRVPTAYHPLALDVRRVIAAFAGVDPELVGEGVTFGDLDIGPADSIDEIDFICRLEAVLGSPFSKSEAARVPSPDFTSRLQIGVFVRAVCAVAAARAETSPTE